MDSEYKREIPEILLRYKLEPEIRDLYVEGRTDLALFNRYLDFLGYKNVKVYEISTISFKKRNFPPSDLDLRKNNRKKILALALILESEIPSLNQVRCIADSDFDIILDIHYTNPILLFTDYTSIEMYLFNEQLITKFCDIVLRGFIRSSKFILEELSKTGIEIFLIRLVNELLNLEIDWIEITRCCVCNKKNLKLDFNFDEYFERLINKNNLKSQKEIILSVIEVFRPKLDIREPRNNMHGHDFIDLFSFYLKKSKNIKGLTIPDVLERSLFGCLEMNMVDNEELFIYLKKWVREGSV